MTKDSISIVLTFYPNSSPRIFLHAQDDKQEAFLREQVSKMDAVLNQGGFDEGFSEIKAVCRKEYHGQAEN